MTTDLNTPYQTTEAHLKGLATAAAFESIALADDIPIAVNPFEINREATRYLFFPGDMLIPSQKRNRPDLRSGGEYFGQNYRTLVRSKGLLRRCQITPMEVGFDFLSDDMVGDDANLHVITTVDHQDPQRGALQAPVSGRLNAIKAYPGDEIKSILHIEGNPDTAKGMVELTQLADVNYADFKAEGYQEFVFPEWDEILAGVKFLPTKLAELENHLRARKSATNNVDLRSMIDEMLAACETWRTWGRNYLKISAQLVKLPAHQGYVHSYSELAEMLFEQLEIRREDMISSDRDIADIIAKAQAGNSISSVETNAILEKLAANQALLTQFLVGQAPKDVVATEEKARCAGTKADGEPCSGWVVGDSEYCRHHSGN